MDVTQPDGSLAVTGWTTDEVDLDDRFAYWREIICAAYVRLRAEPVTSGAFRGMVALSSWRDVQISQVSADGQVVSRPPGGTEDDCLVSVQIAGTGRVTQDGRTAILGPGDLALYDATRPYELAFDDPFAQIVVKFPRAHLQARNVDVRAVAARRCDGSAGMGAVAAAFVRNLSEHCSEIGDPLRGRLGRQAIDCLAVAVALADGVHGSAIDQAVRTAERQRVLAHVAENLTSPDLSVSSIARAFRRSPRSLQMLFADDEMHLGERIRTSRLRLAADALIDPLRHTHSITRIALDCGYADGATFSRAFKARYGCTPLAYRRASGDI